MKMPFTKKIYTKIIQPNIKISNNAQISNGLVVEEVVTFQ